MAQVWLLDLDSKIPNLALMRLAAHHRALGNAVDLRRPRSVEELEPGLFDTAPALVYASLLFERSRLLALEVLRRWPQAFLGGTGWNLTNNIEELRVGDAVDYTVYPAFKASLGFTSRGCRRRCPWCVTPQKEGRPRSVATVPQLWRGEPHKKHLLLLDQDFFGQPEWRERCAEMAGFKVCINGGVNCRTLTDEQIREMAKLRLTDNEFKSRRLYTAWDRLEDGPAVKRGLRRLLQHLPPRSVMVYMLIGFDPDETHAKREARRTVLRDLGVMPFVMPFRRTAELLGYQRWVNFGYDKGAISWERFVAEGYQVHGRERRIREEGQELLKLG